MLCIGEKDRVPLFLELLLIKCCNFSRGLVYLLVVLCIDSRRQKDE